MPCTPCTPELAVRGETAGPAKEEKKVLCCHCQNVIKILKFEIKVF